MDLSRQCSLNKLEQNWTACPKSVWVCASQPFGTGSLSFLPLKVFFFTKMSCAFFLGACVHEARWREDSRVRWWPCGQNGFPGQPHHYPGPHPAVTCDQRWHGDVRDGPDRPRRGPGEVQPLLSIWGQWLRATGQQWGHSGLCIFPISRHYLKLGLWNPKTIKHRSVVFAAALAWIILLSLVWPAWINQSVTALVSAKLLL